MNRFLDVLWRPILPMTAVSAASVLILLAGLAIVQTVEDSAGRLGPFDLTIWPLGDASFVVLACAVMCVVLGIVITRWSVLFAANVSLQRRHGEYALNLAFPLGQIFAYGLVVTGAAVIVFYALRQSL